MTGVLRIVGVGPGDPELMTRRAWRIVRAARTIAFVAAQGGAARARTIAADAVRPDADEIRIETPMARDRAPAQAAYDRGAEEIAARLAQGDDVALLCEGDPFFYGSAMYLASRLVGRFEIDATPGVASPFAAAAASKVPLCARSEPLTLLPATADDAVLEAGLALGGAAILKAGPHLPRLRALLARLGRLDRAVYAEEVGAASERIAPLSQAPERGPYFSMVLAPSEDAHVG